MNSTETAQGIYAAAREDLWCRLLGFPYSTSTKNQKKKMRIQYAKDRGTTPGMINFRPAGFSNIDVVCTVEAAPVAVETYNIETVHINPRALGYRNPNKNNNKETTMNTFTPTPEQQSKDYLQQRLYAIFYDKQIAITKKFGLSNDAKPQNDQDMIDRITAGKYVLADTIDVWGHKYKKIIWRDPAVIADQAGADVAQATLDIARQKAEDLITVMTPVEGLDALNAFEATAI